MLNGSSEKYVWFHPALNVKIDVILQRMLKVRKQTLVLPLNVEIEWTDLYFTIKR